MRLKLTVAYVGTAYSGWQIQKKAQPPPTIQGTLEKVLAVLAGGPVRVHGSGRTDAGVHAHGQVAHCDIPEGRGAKSEAQWQRSLNALLPPDISVLAVEKVHARFHARIDALRKSYAYSFWTERAFVPPSLRPFVWQCGPLDMQLMQKALPCLLGRQDFASLQNSGTDMESTVREIYRASLEIMPACEFYPPHAPMLRLTITANGFLKQMVRNTAGLLAACGQGRLDPAAVPSILAARDRRALPAVTAPASGLSLLQVEYPPLPADQLQPPAQSQVQSPAQPPAQL